MQNFVKMLPHSPSLPTAIAIFTFSSFLQRAKGFNAMHQSSPELLTAFIVIQCCGLLSAMIARLGIGTMCQGLAHLFFHTNMLITGLATAWTVMIGLDWWLWSGTTLCAMILVAVVDWRTHERLAMR
jgi:hypothetical protein